MGEVRGLGPVGPSLVFAWMAIVIKEIRALDGATKEEVQMVSRTIQEMEDHFQQLDLIDKMQFPLPYAQMVKIMMVAYMAIMPFILAPRSGYATPLIMVLI